MKKSSASPAPDETSEDWTGRLARHRTCRAVFRRKHLRPDPTGDDCRAADDRSPEAIPSHRDRDLARLPCLFYFVGMWLREPVVLQALEWLSLTDLFADLSRELEGGELFGTVFLVSFSPAPMQLATLGAGAVGGNFVVFLSAIVTRRGLRYVGLAILAQLFGRRIERLDVPKRTLVPVLLDVATLGWILMQIFQA